MEEVVVRFAKGVIIGGIAAAGASALGLPFPLFIVFGIPVLVAMLNLLVAPVFIVFLLFGLGSFIWAYTPIGDMAAPLVAKLTQIPPPVAR
jgi:hypothetical protein